MAKSTKENDAFDNEVNEESRLDALKRKATLLGISFRENISESTLADRINKHLEDSEDDPDDLGEDADEDDYDLDDQEDEDEEEVADDKPKKEHTGRLYTEEEVRAILAAQGDTSLKGRTTHKSQVPLTPRQRSLLLHRVIVRPIDPRRTQLDGEFITAGNHQLGTTGKFIPFNAEQGYHVPEIILNSFAERTFTEYYTVEDMHGNEKTLSRQRNAFIIEHLPPLTEDELAEIRARQRGNMED